TLHENIAGDAWRISIVMAFQQGQRSRRIRAALETMRKAVIALLVLITAGPAMADALPRRPNEFEYWRLWAECGEPYLYCDRTTRTCMSGRIVYEHFVGWVIDANNQKVTPVSITIPAHW